MGYQSKKNYKQNMSILELKEKSRRRDSISDIIERFHRIKEERSAMEPGSHVYSSSPKQRRTHSQNTQMEYTYFNKPSSAERRLGTIKATDFNERRRQSVPHLFRPFDVRSSVDNGPLSSRSPRQDPPLFTNYRRHSVSHAVYEYELAKAQDKKKKLLQAQKFKNNGKTDDSEGMRRWLTGKELHAFYNIWDRPGNTKHNHRLEKLKTNRHLLFPGENHDSTDERPRLSSM